MSKKKQTAPEYDLAGDLKQNRRDYFTLREPTRLFSKGESIVWGNNTNAVVQEVYDGGKLYLVSCDGHVLRGSQQTEPRTQFNVVAWIEIFKKDTRNTAFDFKSKNDVVIDYRNCDMGSLLSQAYDQTNFSPEYQRGYVWDESDKTALLDSIFQYNVEIGKISFVKYDYTKPGFDFDGYMQEILDGKQRVSTLMDFYEDRISYRGCVYSTLPALARHHFDTYPVIIGSVREPKNRSDVLKYFLTLNMGGRVMSQEHLDRVTKMYLDLAKQEQA